MQELIDMNMNNNNNQEGPEEIDYETLIQRKGKFFENDNSDNEEKKKKKMRK